MSQAGKSTTDGIAIVGMAGRFPKARNIDEFWLNLCTGVEAISFFTDEELAAVPRDNPNYVKARGVLEDADLFDAAFFGVNPREAAVMDPQHRVFLECAWEALENAGYDSEKFEGTIGVFAGMSMNTYLAANLHGHRELMASLNAHQIMLANDKDYLPTRVSYKLNLRGPSLNIQTACSTSLVAVCVACQHLLDFQCDMALAGAVAISFPQKQGHFYQEGGIGSPDGHCRPFDAQAAGTVAGAGVGIVVLRRLEDALADGDQIYAVIKGFATNNDGANKIGYTAPSVEGQAEVVALAQAMANVEPETISYIEAHGTGTPLGDPIEIEALTQAFRSGTPKTNFCAVGSVKSGIGHLDTAAGVAGLIKTALALHHRQLPPSLHFESPNPKIDFANSPFFVVNRLTEWQRGLVPLRAGVSSFGIGGTNAHVVLEEAPPVAPPPDSPKAQLLVISAKTATALDQATANLAERLKRPPGLSLADVAWTLQAGRREFTHRRMLVCREADEAVRVLEARDAKQIFTRVVERENPPVVFMFPGQGAQRVNMARELYGHGPVFREQMDRCCEVLTLHLGLDLRTVLYPSENEAERAAGQLTQTAVTQPALFAVEYALARLWMSWGVQPEAMIGHSIGEYVAACLSGVFSLDTALALVAERGRLMQQMPAGAMLAVRLPESEAVPLLGRSLSLSAVNGAALCVASGPPDAVEALRRLLAARTIACTPLQTSHAFHSAMMEPMLGPFTERVRSVKRNAPQIPFISNVTGTWITAEQATDPAYWARHLRQTVRFADGAGELLKVPERVLLEVGPGQTLGGLAKQHPARDAKSLVLSSLPHSKDETREHETLLAALGQLWLAGVRRDWRGLHAHEQRQRVWLPAYPFERQRHFIEPAATASPTVSATKGLENGSHPAPSRSSGRGDKGVVARPGAATASTRGQVVAPATRKERVVAELKMLLSELSGLSLAGMSVTTTFPEIGFDSLFLTQASLAIEKKLGVRVAFRQLLEEFSTLEALAGHIDRTWPAERAGAPTAQPAAADHQSPASLKPVPLTEAQRELWFASQMSDAASCAYNECRLLHLRGLLQPDALNAALQKLVDRHEALRTTFAPGGEEQRIHAALRVEVFFVDWSNLEAEGQTTRLDALQAGEARQPFDLVGGPLLRARLIRLGGQHHALALTVHHIVCDGHSFAIVLRELGELYSAASRGVPARLAPPLQLSDYARAQAHRRESAVCAADEAYWKKQFADGTPVLELPADHPRPAEWTFAGAGECKLLPAALSQELKRVSAQHDRTLFTTLLAGYFLWLHRLTGQEDIVVGIPVADRAMEGGDALVGHCINFLPVRGSVGDAQPFAALLATVQKLFLDAHEHQHCTLGSLLQKLNLPRDPSRMPLASVTFNVERLGRKLKFSGLETELAANPHSFTNFDLSLNVTDIGGVLRLDCRYNSDLFTQSTIQRWLGHFQTLLEGIVADSQQQVAELSLLSAGERRQILVERNDTQADHPRGQCVHELFEEQVARTPEAVAVVCGDQSLTYSELNQRADRLARELRRLGVGPDVPVGICVERSLKMLAGVLGILKAGGAYVPLDPAYPKERIALMLTNARVSVLLTQESVVAGLPESQARVVCLDHLEHTASASEDDARTRSPVTPDNLAYVIHTSGSTGAPKGVAIEHRNTVHFIRWAQRVFSHEELAGVLFATSLCFDLSVFELFVTLSSGGKIILAQSALELPSLPAKNEVTLINTVPSAATELLRLNAIPPSVRVVNLAGEALSAALADRLYALGTVKKVHDLYGPSETTTYSTFALRRPGGPVTIGRPIANTQIYLLDANRQPVPVGVVGEIYIGGEGVARGYLHRPDLTDERFVPNPFIKTTGARLYRTGDLARWLPDGNLEFIGRIDHQVKIRGFRVELGEVESVLAQHPAVHESVVLARRDPDTDQRLVAYVVPNPDRATTAGDLRRWLESKLPDYMVPLAFVFLDALPLTPNGKVDRRTLPAPDHARAESDELFVAPDTPTERALAAMWRDLLGVPRVGIHDNFFELGGHSLLVTRLIVRVREAFQVELPLRRVFQAPTIAALAGAIEELLVAQVSNLSDEEARRALHGA